MDHHQQCIVAITVLVAGFITETVFELALATYTKPLVGLIATPDGLPPTGIVATTVLVAGFITETVFERTLVTYTKPLVGLIATPYEPPNGVRPSPTGIVATTVLVAGLLHRLCVNFEWPHMPSH